MQAIVHGKIILEDKIAEGLVLLYDEKIEALIPLADFSPENCAEIIDAAGKYVAPGFINVHIHGCKGVDAMDDTEEALALMRRVLPATGVTAFLPTTMTADFSAIYRSLARIRAAMGAAGGAEVLGAHLEGPFISEAYKGAQAAKNIAAADFNRISAYKDTIKIITLAPETLQGSSFMADCRQNGILVSLGHTAADYEQSLAAMEAGASRVTHLFNAMPPLHHRRPGVVGAALDTKVNCELIADNVHVHPAMQRLVYRCKEMENIILITDSMRACLLPDGKSELGGQAVFVENQIARLADGTIAGSVLTMNEAVKRFWQNTGADLPAVIAMAAANPARELGLYGERGSIRAGKRADLTIFAADLTIFNTIVKGKMVYHKE